MILNQVLQQPGAVSDEGSSVALCELPVKNAEDLEAVEQ